MKTQPPHPTYAAVSPTLAETLLYISNELLTTDDTPRLLGRILELLRRLVEYETAAIHLVDGDRLITCAGVGAAEPTVGQFNYRQESDFVWQYLEKEGRPYLSQDLHQESWHPMPGFEYIRSFMAVPLVLQGKLIGVLTVDHSQPECFNDEQLKVVSIFASHASIVMARANLLETERSQRHFAESQLAFSYRLMQTTSIEEAIQALLSAIAQNAPFHTGSVTLIDRENSHRGYIAATYGYTNPDEARYQSVDMQRLPLLAQLTALAQPIYLPDTRDAPRWQPGSRADTQEVRSVLLVPLLQQTPTELFGYITLKNFQPNAFSQSAVGHIVLLCNQTAAALRTLRSLEETRYRLSEVSLLAELSAHLNRTHELTDALHFVLNRIVSVIGQGGDTTDIRGAVILRRPNSHTLHLAAGHNLEAAEIEQFNNRPYSVHEGTFARSIGKGEWVEINDKEAVGNAIAEQFSRTPPRQLLDIPLRAGTETIGIISIDRVVRDPATRQLLTAMADLAGSAIQKTQALADSRQRAVELMETYERLQVMDRQRDEFIQNITHDLKAPLTFIRGYAELMAESALGEITAEQGEALGIIQERTDAINRLIGDILTLKQVESQPLQQIVFNLDAIARKSARNARMSARLAGLEIAVLSKKKQALVKGDMARMEQVFENLLSNAIKYSPDGGEIRLLVKVEADKIWVSVSDQGIGIAPEEIENIWSRYYRVPGVSAGGSGLGLANVRRVIEAHGGRISVQSEGKGTTFTFQLPRHQE